jgi:hypothetical protein
MEWHAERVFRSLFDHANRTTKAIEAAQMPSLLEGSEIVADHLRGKLKGARFVLDIVTGIGLPSHDRLRQSLGLHAIKATSGDGVLMTDRLLSSKSEVDEEIQDLIKNPRPLRPSAARWSFSLLLIGSLLTVTAA